MDGLIEQLKETAKGIEQQRQDLKEAGYHLERAIQILEGGDDQVRVQIQEQKLERMGRGLVTERTTGKAALMERLEDPEQLPEVKVPAMPPVEPPAEEPLPSKIKPTETRPTSQQMSKGPTRYRNVSTRTAILDVLDSHREPADAKEITQYMITGGWMGGKDNPLQSVRAALSAMRLEEISQKKIQVGPRKIIHYYLPTMEEMTR